MAISLTASMDIQGLVGKAWFGGGSQFNGQYGDPEFGG